MEFCENGNLKNWIEENHKIIEKIEIIKDFFNGLSFLHQNNIIHFDLKLENILLSRKTVKIAHLGSSLNFKVLLSVSKKGKFPYIKI